MALLFVNAPEAPLLSGAVTETIGKAILAKTFSYMTQKTDQLNLKNTSYQNNMNPRQIAKKSFDVVLH